MNRPSSIVRLAASALAALSLLGAFAYSSEQPTNPAIQLTGSGHEAPEPTYQKPAVGDMKLGVTETTTTPPAAPAVSMATPADVAAK